MLTNGSESPCVLVVDDDAITLRFFEAAFGEMRIACACVTDGASALVAIGKRTFDLLLIDRHLPDTTGPSLLKTLRKMKITTPAIATSAEVDAHVRSAMLDAGFDEVIAKPIGVQQLRDIVARYITPSDDGPFLLLDDGAALGALGGSVDSLAALRALLADELDQLIGAFSGATVIDPDQCNARLHRLRASCGFCGATALAQAAKTLQSSLHDQTRDHRFDVSAFLECCAATARHLREPMARR